jgi:hypothetical protein
VFTHIACFRWVEGTGADDVETVIAALTQLPGLIPEIREYRCGADAGLAEGNYDFAVVASFDDYDDYVVYATHPAHERVLSDVVRPRVASRVAVQFVS